MFEVRKQPHGKTYSQINESYRHHLSKCKITNKKTKYVDYIDNLSTNFWLVYKIIVSNVFAVIPLYYFTRIVILSL